MTDIQLIRYQSSAGGGTKSGTEMYRTTWAVFYETIQYAYLDELGASVNIVSQHQN